MIKILQTALLLIDVQMEFDNHKGDKGYNIYWIPL